MAATVLEIPVDKVYISETSTVTVPNAVETGGSFVADLNGGAVMVSLTTFQSENAVYIFINPDRFSILTENFGIDIFF